MKINVGDYVRTKGGNIFKIIGGNTDNWEVDISCIQLEQIEENWYESNRYNDNGYWFNEENIIKSSSNIIDLIQVGDYVNGDRVKALKGDIESHKINNEDDVIYTEYINDYDEWCGFEEDEIKSIVTKEQFESMEYKIGEKE